MKLENESVPKIYQFPAESWAEEFARLLSGTIKKCVFRQNCCNLMLTGGRSAAQLYKAWALQPDFQHLAGVNFYFGDERCVSPDDHESNHGMTMRTLFHFGIPSNCRFMPMPGDAPDIEVAANDYALLLPDSIDILLLSVGEDGHIASLFPNSSALKEEKQHVLYVRGNKPPYNRLTITRPLIEKACQIFVMACGDKKREILNQLRAKPDDYFSVPARLALRGTWITEG